MGKKNKKAKFDYFDAFLSCAKSGRQAAGYLNELLSDFDPATIVSQVERMHEIEHAADDQKHEVLRHLSNEFIAPIEREDIVALCQALDNVVDAIEDVMQRIYMFNVTELKSQVAALTGLIVQCTEALVITVKEFKNFKKSKIISEYVIKVNTIESNGDHIYTECMRELYTKSDDPRELLVWTTMFECLENCLDACEDAADIIESIVMKNT